MRVQVLALVAAVAAGCVTPRSVGLGQTAQVMGAGGAAVGTSAALLVELNRASGGSGTNSTTVAFPSVEANGALGLTDSLDLNVHLSSAGLQPGVKIALLTGAFKVSVLPQVALLIVSANNSNTAGASSSQLNVGILAGLRFLVSHETGLFGGLAYDFQYGTISLAGVTGGGTSSSTSVMAHNLTFNVGYDLKFGRFHLQPELAFVVTPTYSAGSGASTSSAGPVFAFLPAVTLCVENSASSR